jgi:hypothetical protein
MVTRVDGIESTGQIAATPGLQAGASGFLLKDADSAEPLRAAAPPPARMSVMRWGSSAPATGQNSSSPYIGRVSSIPGLGGDI